MLRGIFNLVPNMFFLGVRYTGANSHGESRHFIEKKKKILEKHFGFLTIRDDWQGLFFFPRDEFNKIIFLPRSPVQMRVFFPGL